MLIIQWHTSINPQKLFEKSNLLQPWRLEVTATRDFTHLRGFENLDFVLFRAGGH